MTRKATDRTNLIRRSSLWALGLVALLLPLTLSAQKASAELRVRAELRTPHVSVRLGNTHDRMLPRRPLLRLRACDDYSVRLSKWDRKVARRMSHMTGVRKGRLLNLRRSGFSWREIGWDIGLSRREIRWALRGGKYGHYYAYGNGPKRGHRGR